MMSYNDKYLTKGQKDLAKEIARLRTKVKRDMVLLFQKESALRYMILNDRLMIQNNSGKYGCKRYLQQ